MSLHPLARAEVLTPAPTAEQVRVADWSMYQAVYHGDPHNLGQLYDPAYWTVVIDFNKVKAACSGVIIRVGIGTRKDPCFDRFLAGLQAAGIPFGIYHAYDPSADPVHQARLVRQWCPETPPLGVWGDVEMGTAISAVTMVYLASLDDTFGTQAGIYSGGPYLDNHFTAAQQDELESRPLWVAGYPNFWPPYAWNKGANHALHQYTDAYQLPGLAKACDMSVPGPAWTKESAPVTNTPPQVVVAGVAPGAGHGFHGEQSNQIIPLIKRGLEIGIHYKLLNSVENPGRCREAFDLDHNIITIFRYLHPNPRWENGQDAEKWDAAERLAYVRSAIQLLFLRTNPWERGGIKLYTPGMNEWNLEGDLANWTCVGEILHLMMDEAERRSEEFGQPIMLAVPGIAQGKPQYWQMKQMVATGCFDRMAARGDLFTVHAGRYRWQTGDPIPGLGDVIPGAPYCPPFGGSGDGRINYFYDLGVHCDFAVTEGYDGLSKSADPRARLFRMKQTDDLYRRNRHYKGTAWYEYVDNQDSTWEDTDFTPTVRSDVFEQEMIREANVPNPTTGDDEMPILYHAKALIDLAVRDSQGNPTTDPVATPPAQQGLAGVVKAGTTLHIYAENVTAGPWQDRAAITPDGKSVWAVAKALAKA